MILASRKVKLASLSTQIHLSVVGSTPTSAAITWLKDPEKPTLGTNSKTVTVTNLGNSDFSLTAFIPAQQFWVKLNTEARKLLFENTYKDEVPTDKVLAFTGNTNSFDLQVPFCDLATLNIEIYTVDGDKLEVFGDSVKFWYATEVSIFNGYTKPKLCYKISVFGARLRLGDAAWRRQEEYSSFYVKVSNLRNVITNDVLLSTVVDQADYQIEYLNKKNKVERRAASWGCTISA